MTELKIDHFRHLFKGALIKLRENLLMMASLTDRNLKLALNAYFERDDSKADLVIAEDDVIDSLEVDIDEQVVVYISTHGTIASYTRLLLTMSKISEALENISDQAVTIARRAKHLNSLPEVQAKIDLDSMAKLTIEMIRDSITSFVEADASKTLELIKRDKKVDALNRANEEVLNVEMMNHPENITACLHLLLISRSMERACDQAKKIAEDVHYLYTAQDIRHEKSKIASDNV